MEQEIQQLRSELISLTGKIDTLSQEVKQQTHNGTDGRQVDFNNLIGLIKTVTSSSELTNLLASKPSAVRDQILIDTTTATKKLYLYDAVGNVWRSCTIA